MIPVNKKYLQFLMSILVTRKPIYCLLIGIINWTNSESITLDPLEPRTSIQAVENQPQHCTMSQTS